MNKEKFNRIQNIIFKTFWWLIVIIYAYAYTFYMPHSTFGESQFTFLLWGINFLTGLYIIMRTGRLIK